MYLRYCYRLLIVCLFLIALAGVACGVKEQAEEKLKVVTDKITGGETSSTSTPPSTPSVSGQSGAIGPLGEGWDTLTFSGISSDADINEAISWKGPWINSFKPDADQTTPSAQSPHTPVVVNLGSKDHRGIPLGDGLVISFREPRQELQITLWAGEPSREVSLEVLDSDGISLGTFDRSSFEETEDRAGTLTLSSESENFSTISIKPVGGTSTQSLSGFHLDRLSFKPSNDELASRSSIWQVASEEIVKREIEPKERIETIKQLKGFPSQLTLQTLIEVAASTDNIEVKKQAILAIAEFPERDSINDLYQIGMNGRDPDLKMVVTQAIWAIGQNYPHPDLPQVEFDIQPVDGRGDYVELTATISSPVHWDSLVANFERTKTANTLSRNSYLFPTGATDLQYRQWEIDTTSALESILEVADPGHTIDNQQYVGPIDPNQPIQLKAYYSTESDAGEMPLRFKVDISHLEVYKKDYIVYFDRSQKPPVFSLEPLPGMDSGFGAPKASAPTSTAAHVLGSPLSASCVMNAPVKVRLEGRILFQDGDSTGNGGKNPLAHIEFGSPDGVTVGKEYKAAKPAKFVSVIASDPCDPLTLWRGGNGDTDDHGYFSFYAYLAPGNEPKLSLIVNNSHADIYADTDCINERLPHRYTGQIVPVGIGKHEVVPMGTHVVKLKYEVIEVGECTVLGIGPEPDLTLSFASTLNVNDVIYTTKRDVLAARSPNAEDGIGQVTVEYCDKTWNQYFDDILLTCPYEEGSRGGWPPAKWFVLFSETSIKYDYGLVDETIAHEYAHHLQYEIGTWDAHSGGHKTCVSESSAPWYLIFDSGYEREMAWSEGFGSYLARYITFKNADLMSEVGISSEKLNPEQICREIDPVTGSLINFDNPQTVEGPIIEALWDLTDGWGSLGKNTYTIQQKINGRFVDAYETSTNDLDYSLVTRAPQPDYSQTWVLDPPLGTSDDNTYTIQHLINGRFVDAHETSADGKDHSVVTRPWQNNDSQRWILSPLGNDTYTIQQKINDRFIDAHKTSAGEKDHSVVTRWPWQNDDSQKWILKPSRIEQELWDQVDGSFSEIVQIFDEELDLGSAWGGAEAPTFADFYKAWSPINQEGLNAILAKLNFVPYWMVEEGMPSGNVTIYEDHFLEAHLVLGAEAAFSKRVTPTAEDAIVNSYGIRPEYDKKPIYTYLPHWGNEPATLIKRRYSYVGSEYLEKRFTAGGRGSEAEDDNVKIYAGVTNLGDVNLPLFKSDKPDEALDYAAIFSDFVVEPKEEGSLLPSWLLPSNGIFEKNLLKGIELTIDLAKLVGAVNDPEDMGKGNIKTLASDTGEYTADLVLKAFVKYAGAPSYEEHLPIKNIKVTLTVEDGPLDDIDDDGLSSHHEIFYNLLPDIPPITATLLADNPVSFCPDPTDRDSDRDGLNDGKETKLGTSPCHQDTDKDGLTDYDEHWHPECMNPLIARNYGTENNDDYDDDGLTDEKELGYNHTPISDPCDGDSDDDGIQDGNDNCVTTPNTLQLNNDGDLYGDACDWDDDNDFCPDDIDPQPLIQNLELASECELSLFKYKTADGKTLNLGEWIGYLHSLFNPVREEYLILAVNPEGFIGDSCGQRACPPPQLVLFNDQLQEVTRFEAHAYGLGRESAFGSAVSWIPDIDGDGIHDFAVGAPSALNRSTGVQTGAVLLLSSQNSKELGRIEGVYEGGQFGSSIAFLGGSSIAIGAPSSRKAGMVAITDLSTLSFSQQIMGEANDSQFGQSIFGVADLDNDGTNDLLIGAPHDQGSGAVYLASIAKKTTTALLRGEYQGEGVGMALSAQRSESAGEQISILVGSPDFRGVGRVVKMTSSGDIIWESLGPSMGSEYGTSLSVSRTAGSSGIDVLVGAPGNDGGKGTVYSLSAGGEVVRKISAPEGTDRFGQRVLLRERTADGNQHDVLISRSQSPSEGQEDNSAFVYRSNDR